MHAISILCMQYLYILKDPEFSIKSCNFYLYKISYVTEIELMFLKKKIFAMMFNHSLCTFKMYYKLIEFKRFEIPQKLIAPTICRNLKLILLVSNMRASEHI